MIEDDEMKKEDEEEDDEEDKEVGHHDLVTNKVFASLQTFFTIRAQLVCAAKLLPSYQKNC